MIATPSEDTRHKLALIFVNVGWLGSFGMLIYIILTTDDGQRPQPWQSLGMLFLVGVAIAASAALGRMRLQDTITKVFESGLTALERDERRNADAKHKSTLRNLRRTRRGVPGCTEEVGPDGEETGTRGEGEGPTEEA